MTTLSTEAANFSWLLGNFVKSVPGVQHTLVVSADGLLMAMSDDVDRTQGDQLAAIVSGLSSTTASSIRVSPAAAPSTVRTSAGWASCKM